MLMLINIALPDINIKLAVLKINCYLGKPSISMGEQGQLWHIVN